MTRQNLRHLISWLLGIALFAEPVSVFAKGYSSGGHSYSSHSSSSGSSSHSFSSGSSHSFSSGSTHSSSSGFSSSHPGSSSSGTKSFSSGGSKSYTSGSSVPGDRKGYSASKSYSSGGGSTTFYSGGSKSSGSPAAKAAKSTSSSSGSSGFTYDTSAARARKEDSSRSDFSKYKESQSPPVINRRSGSDYSGRPPPISTSTRSYNRTYTRTVYVPDYTVIRTRPSRINVYFGSYAYRPWVYYNDSYSSLFWWWLLDRSIDEQAYWAYHHRYDMDPSRYDSLMASNQQLQQRVSQLESQQVARDPSYTPPSLDQTNRDLMYSDQYVNQSFQTRSTPSGRAAFWVFAVPACAGFCALSIWLIWFKRWQVTT